MKFASNDDGRSQAHDPTSPPSKTTPSSSTGANLGFGERAISAAGAAVVSAIIVNPLDVAKTRLQAQAAGFSNQGLCGAACFETNMMFPDLKQAVPGSEPLCTLECNRYKGTIDVFYKITRQLWICAGGIRKAMERYICKLSFGCANCKSFQSFKGFLAFIIKVGIYLPCYDIFRNLLEDFTTQNVPGLTPYVPLVAGSISRSLACVTCYPLELARTRMQAFKDIQNGAKPPGVWKTLFEMINPMRGTNNLQKQQSYRILWTGLGAQLARDVPFSAICWSTLEPIRRRILTLIDDESRAASVLGANFSAGFVAGTIAAAVTCPLDVARTRRQIEDPARALNMTTIQTLREVWRDGGVKGLFTGIGPRVARTGPSVGIVVSFYEIVKYTLHHRRHQATD
ncbi:mitochondrial carrier protein MTM1 isoform X2 [Mercurialis annua]|uniref:mitochondrial carrier protein MTM1 isoform X2 n=1 Tax=Mercurialis annua TaxID=3986 RepID=UPI00215EB9FF|nr:mitochondrial carrier protein MTM1 isoform X2 [Mercurialis annua]